MTSCTGRTSGGFGRILKKSELSLAVRRRVTFASSQWPCGGCPHVLGGLGSDGKASIERLCLSPYVENLFTQR